MIGQNANVYGQVELHGSIDHLINELRYKHRRPVSGAVWLWSNLYDALMHLVICAKDVGSGVIGWIRIPVTYALSGIPHRCSATDAARPADRQGSGGQLDQGQVHANRRERLHRYLGHPVVQPGVVNPARASGRRRTGQGRRAEGRDRHPGFWRDPPASADRPRRARAAEPPRGDHHPLIRRDLAGTTIAAPQGASIRFAAIDRCRFDPMGRRRPSKPAPPAPNAQKWTISPVTAAVVRPKANRKSRPLL